MNSLIKRLKKNDIRCYEFRDIIIGEYLGEGGFSSVYKCFIRDKLYAAKRLYYDFDDNFTQFKNELFKELMVSKIMNSKRLTKVFGYSFDEENNEFYIIMEYLTNGDFYSYSKRCCFTYQEKLKMFNSLVLAVKSLHDIDYIHCDLKTDNFSYNIDSVKNKNYMKLFDYNFMIKGKENPNHLVHGHVVTKGYSSPESYYRERVCKKSDIYSLGVILLELLVEHDLWYKTNCWEKCNKNVEINLRKYKKINPELSNVISRCLTENIKQRYSSEELYNEINFFNLYF